MAKRKKATPTDGLEAAHDEILRARGHYLGAMQVHAAPATMAELAEALAEAERLHADLCELEAA